MAKTLVSRTHAKIYNNMSNEASFSSFKFIWTTCVSSSKSSQIGTELLAKNMLETKDTLENSTQSSKSCIV